MCLCGDIFEKQIKIAMFKFGTTGSFNFSKGEG